MTFTRTCQTTFAALFFFSLIADDGFAAGATQATTPTSPAPLAGNQLAFDQGVTAYDSGDFKTAYSIWLPLAKEGDLAAQRNVAHMLRRGIGVPQDLERALWFYERAARAGLASAALNAGMMRIEPESPFRDLDKGAEWLNLAAAGGSPDAMWELARLIGQGSKSTPADLEAARALIARAAELGHEGAQRRLNDAESDTARPLPPAEIKPDHAQPSAPVTPSPSPPTAPIGLVSPDQGAQFMKGIYHFDAGDFAAAAEQWRPLAENGVPEAQYRLGRLYRFGLGVGPDVEIARKWLSAAASQGHEKAKETLAILPTP